jgi:hypothetical protein
LVVNGRIFFKLRFWGAIRHPRRWPRRLVFPHLLEIARKLPILARMFRAYGTFLGGAKGAGL